MVFDDIQRGRGRPGRNGSEGGQAPPAELRLRRMYSDAGRAYAQDPDASPEESGLSQEAIAGFADRDLAVAYGAFVGLVLSRKNLQPIGRRSGENKRGDDQALRTLGRLITDEVVDRHTAGRDGLDPDELYANIAFGLGTNKFSTFDRPQLVDELPAMWYPQLRAVPEDDPTAHMNDYRQELRRQVFRNRAIEEGSNILAQANVDDLIAFPEPETP